MDTGHIHHLAEQIHQAGLDQAADVVAEFLAGRSEDELQAYRDGIEDALLTLIQAGATDPR